MNILWLQSGGCGGCTMSLLCAEQPHALQQLSEAGFTWLWHPSLSELSNQAVIELLTTILHDQQKLDVLCVEGAILRGPNGTGAFHKLAGTQQSMWHWVQQLAAKAQYTLAIGTCAAFGGMSAAGNNPTDACGLQYDGHLNGGALGKDYRSLADLPVINVAGCPTHPAWVLDTLKLMAWQGITTADLDKLARPRFYTEHLVHHGCSRNEYYEYKASAEKPSDLGCMMEYMGCLGTQAHADCNLHTWNGQGSCTRAGYACINCTSPEFEESGHSFLHTPNIAGIPIGLPTDMPKAWFVALASLSKAATPKRVKTNAVSDHIVIEPGNK